MACRWVAKVDLDQRSNSARGLPLVRERSLGPQPVAKAFPPCRVPARADQPVLHHPGITMARSSRAPFQSNMLNESLTI